MKSYLVVAVVLIFFAGHTKAQGKGHEGVVVHTDPRLGLLMQKKYTAPMAAKTAATAKTAKMPGTDKAVKPEKGIGFSERIVNPRKGVVVYSGKGFRVQIYNGPDRAKATDIKNEFMRRNPGVRTYLTYVSPSFRVKVGNYRNRSDAEGMYREARSTYTPCMIVPDIITISTF